MPDTRITLDISVGDGVKPPLRVAILGVLAREPVAAGEVMALAKHVVGRMRQPTTDLVAGTLGELVERGYVRPDSTDVPFERRHFEITAAGRRALDAALCEPLGNESVIAAMTLWVAFLDLLPATERRRVLGDLIGAFDQEIRRFAMGVERCACAWDYVHGWLQLEVEQMERQRAWLAGLMRQIGGEPPAAASAA